MAELTHKSPGVSTREIDNSQPSVRRPTGIPAGIVGTSLSGPAFVPLTFSSYNDFVTVFGESDGSKFGPIAVNQWLANASSVTYMRILGAGNGLKRSDDGIVTNAGFKVGDNIVQGNGFVNSNSKAVGATKGRTYFLGAFMSESNGSTIFSEAGIQGTTVASGAPATKTLTIGSRNMGGGDKLVVKDGHGNTLTITIGLGTKDLTFTDGDYTVSGVDGAQTIVVTYNVAGMPSNNEFAQGFVNAIRGAAAHASSAFKMSAVAYSSGTNIVLLATQGSKKGNDATVTVTDVGGTMASDFSLSSATETGGFAGGFDGNHAVPILRGVLLAPSGVILHLSGNSSTSGNTPIKGVSAEATPGAPTGRMGGLTGSLDLKSQEFVLLMNGYNNEDISKSTFITASLDVTAPNYFTNVFNTNPLKIEEEGHLLYASYDVYPTYATVTGSGIITAGTYSRGVTDSSKEDVVFLLTSSKGRGETSLANVPDYENFEDRFSNAQTPWVISQNFGSNPKNLFKIHMLSSGEGLSTKLKFSIENIKKASSLTNKYGKFDLVLRDFYDTDNSKIVVESFRGLSLDTTSDRYIGRIVGDQHIYYNFDIVASSQKLVVDGNYPVRSRYIRVELSDDLDNGNIPAESLPLGYRGPQHIVTSGSMLSNQLDSANFTSQESVLAITEIPIPYRETIAIGTGIKKQVNNDLYWGTQWTRKTVVEEPNKRSYFDKSLLSFTKHFPNHLNTTTKFVVGDNAGTADVNGSILDSDRFNSNKFTLENIRVRTGSDGYAAADQWMSASYVRNGVITVNPTLATRAFNVNDLSKVANIKYAKFTFFAQGGWNGNNIFDEEKSNMTNTAVYREIEDPNSAGIADNTVASFKKSIDIMSSKDDIDIQLFAIPGIRHSSVTDYAIQGIENRFDAMYIMDVEERDQYNTIITSSVQKPHVAYTVASFKNKGLDSSMAAAYFPDVVVKDPSTGTLVQVPPSVAVLGAYSLNDRVAYPWFAPAGFTRGALGAVENTAVKLNRTNLDDLYESSINPIAEFPGAGLIIWGQKTLQAASTSLDRVNVRRMLIEVRRKVRQVANSFIFEPLKEAALADFKDKVSPILQKIKEKQGVARYKIVIDTSTTTQADIDNNTIRGIIWVQPIGVAEFMSIDFTLDNLGS